MSALPQTAARLANALRVVSIALAAPAPPAPPRTARYPNFDILRLFLAVEVAAVHIWFVVDPNFAWNPYFMAVPGFLSISGFLVLQSYAESGSWGYFVRKRAFRVLPALAVSLALCGVLFGFAGAYNSVLTWISGGLYARHGFANGPLWSLAWEELAYLLLAVLWLAGAYRRPAAIWCLLVLASMIVWAGRHLSSETQTILFLGPAFFTGNLIYMYRARFLDMPRWLPWVVLYAAVQWRLLPDSALFGGILLLLVQAFTLVLVGIAGARLIPARFPDLSYGIYVYHYPILVYMQAYRGITDLSRLAIATALVVLPIALVSWYLVEKPILKWSHRQRSIKSCAAT